MKNRNIILEDNNVTDASIALGKQAPTLLLKYQVGCLPKDIKPDLYFYPPNGGSQPALWRKGTSSDKITGTDGKSYAKNTLHVYYLESGDEVVFWDPANKKEIAKTKRPCALISSAQEQQFTPNVKAKLEGLFANFKNESVPEYNNEYVEYTKLPPTAQMSGSWKLVKVRDEMNSRPNTTADIKNQVSGELGDAYIWKYLGVASKTQELSQVDYNKLVDQGFKQMGELTQNVQDFCKKTPGAIQTVKKNDGTTVQMCKPPRDTAIAQLKGLATDLQTKLDNGDTKQIREACKPYLKEYINASTANKKAQGFDVSFYKDIAIQCFTQSGLNKLNAMRFLDDDRMRLLQYQLGDWSLGNVETLMDKAKGGMRESIFDRNLKNLIRENLELLSEDKKKSIIQEEKIIKGRFSIVTEGTDLKTKKGQKKLAKDLFNESLYLSSQGFDKKLINEGFWDILGGLFGNAPEGVLQYFKEYAGQWIVETLLPMDPDGWLANIIIAAIGEFPITDIGKFTDCGYMTKYLSGAIAEGALRKVQHEKVGGGPLYDIIRNSLVDTLEETSFGQKIEGLLGELICPMLGKVSGKMQDISQTMTNGALGLT